MGPAVKKKPKIPPGKAKKLVKSGPNKAKKPVLVKKKIATAVVRSTVVKRNQVTKGKSVPIKAKSVTIKSKKDVAKSDNLSASKGKAYVFLTVSQSSSGWLVFLEMIICEILPRLN